MKNSVKWMRRGSFLMFVLLMLVQVTTIEAAGNSNPGVLPPNSSAFGKTYTEWNDAWWQWALSTPVPQGHIEQHPLLDPTGTYCSAGQSGHVWFLGGSFNSNSATRYCTIPTGTALFFPIIDVEIDNITPPYATIDEFRAIIKGWVDGVTQLSATIDGKALTDLQKYRFESKDGFDVNVPEQSLTQFLVDNAGLGIHVVPGFYKRAVVAGGYYLLLNPLSAGVHKIEFSAAHSSGFSQGFTYILTVKK